MLLIHCKADTFSLYYTDQQVLSDELSICSKFFQVDSNSKTNLGFIGFFDWLRASKTDIVGIRLCYFEDQGYNEILGRYLYFSPTYEGKCMEMLFEEREYTHDLCDDQDFTNNYIYTSIDDEYILTFGTDFLSDAEIDSLKRYCKLIDV